MTNEPRELEMLRREHRIATNLLDRIAELGRRIDADDPVPPSTVRLGVGLLDAYLHRVHTRQFDLDLAPVAREVIGPECREALQRIRDEHISMRNAAREVLELTDRWARGDPRARDQIPPRLVSMAASDRATNADEEHHPFLCLPAAVPVHGWDRIRVLFDGHAKTKAAVEAHIQRFLASS